MKLVINNKKPNKPATPKTFDDDVLYFALDFLMEEMFEHNQEVIDDHGVDVYEQVMTWLDFIKLARRVKLEDLGYVEN